MRVRRKKEDFHDLTNLNDEYNVDLRRVYEYIKSKNGVFRTTDCGKDLKMDTRLVKRYCLVIEALGVVSGYHYRFATSYDKNRFKNRIKREIKVLRRRPFIAAKNLREYANTSDTTCVVSDLMYLAALGIIKDLRVVSCNLSEETLTTGREIYNFLLENPGVTIKQAREVFELKEQNFSCILNSFVRYMGIDFNAHKRQRQYHREKYLERMRVLAHSSKSIEDFDNSLYNAEIAEKLGVSHRILERARLMNKVHKGFNHLSAISKRACTKRPKKKEVVAVNLPEDFEIVNGNRERDNVWLMDVIAQGFLGFDMTGEYWLRYREIYEKKRKGIDSRTSPFVHIRTKREKEIALNKGHRNEYSETYR